MKHGLRNTDGPHAGDLPDLYVNTRWRRALRSAGTEYFARRGKAHTDGKAIVVHAASDDNITDPSGNSGDRIACGVILLSVINGVIDGS